MSDGMEEIKHVIKVIKKEIDDEEVKTLDKEDVKNAMSQLGVPFAGFAEVKNWDSLVDQHLAGGAQSNYPVLKREYVNQCCRCKATTVDDRMPIKGCPNCKHMWCPTCCLVEKDNVERVTAMNEKSNIAPPGFEGYVKSAIQKFYPELLTEAREQWIKEHTIANWPYKQPFPVFNLGPDRETRYQTYHRGFRDGYDAAVRQYEGKEPKPTEE